MRGTPRDGVLRAVAEAIRRDRLIGEKDAVLVAVSGGADSVALLAALAALGAPDRRIGVGHVNHHLRGKHSDGDQRFVERLAADFGCEAYVADEPLSGSANLEERARERRYAALHAMARREGFRAIATAHTLDDQAETVLHRLLRGTGGAGLAAIARDRGDGVIRPLLDVSRAEILEFLRRRGLSHRTDRTNASARFTRNRLRHRVLPVIEREINPAAKRALARLAELSLEDERSLEEAASRLLGSVERGTNLDARALRRAPRALRRRLLRRWLRAKRGDLKTIELDHVERLDALAAGGRDGQRLSIPGGTVTLQAGRLVWNLGQPKSFSPGKLSTGRAFIAGDWRLEMKIGRARPVPGKWRAAFDATKVGGPLRVRPPRAGDRLRPLGLGGSKKLQDVFVDAKVLRDERIGWPVVEDSRGVILWVPGLVRSEVAPLRAETRRHLVVEARKGRRK